MEKRFDERDIMFTRMGLKAGSERYEAYYQRCPGRKDIDDELRSLEEMQSQKPRKDEAMLGIHSKISKAVLQHARQSSAFAKGQAVAEEKTELTPEEMSYLIKETAKKFGADLVGIAEVKPNQHYTHHGRRDTYGEPIALDYRYAVVVACELYKDLINRAPQMDTYMAAMLGYAKSSTITAQLVTFIKAMGYDAMTDDHECYYSPMVPLSHNAGLGEMGRCNMIVNPKIGNRMKTGALLTNLELIPDGPKEFGLEAFCKLCMKCADQCPVKAISHDAPQMVNGQKTYHHDEMQCMKMWIKCGGDCGMCMAVCPFSQGVDPDLIDRMRDNPEVMGKILRKHEEKHGKRAFIKGNWPFDQSS